eukprot:gnl/MRDRNA2_/MRDRNA2_96448_c0_seq1.p1 gnl/MRDRNA2_/MRDRNA2_96448_c0~~gnl/MRDRNA2_/MRDRNA2_96448_c0_seq1.p1  ORF type:complete len:324 (-),score=56.46 gnl/MRDRNA2_/MRDRNA2_96448_c0_seq1:148-1119(-)
MESLNPKGKQVLAVAATAGAIGFGILVLLKIINGQVKIFLEKGKRKKVKLLSVDELSHDTKRFRLDLGGKNVRLGLPTGQHIKLYCPNPQGKTEGMWNGKPDPDKGKSEVSHAYTPTTGDWVHGYVDLVIKIYRPGTVKMPDGREMVWEDGGKVSRYLDGLKAGDSIDIMGPTGLITYLGSGEFKLPGNRKAVAKKVGMMAGGTGLTPMLQVVSASLQDPADKTEFSLLYANKTENDILVKDLLDSAVASSNGRFKVHYTLDFPPEGWRGHKGFITTDMIKECLPAPGPDTLVVMCGPPPMIEFACKKNLETLGYPKESQVAF